MTLTIGSLFSGYGGLDMSVETVTGGRTVWHCDNDPAATKLLTHRYPGVPNLGDITTVDWNTVEPVDIIDGGSPCQDVSSAGKRAGMRTGTRSGLWASMCDAIATIRPRLVVWENVRGVLSAEADSALEPCPGCVGGGDDGPVLRALGRVLGDLADIGYDASWHGLSAASIGAPHGRFRVFVVAWPAADTNDRTSNGERSRSAPSGRGAVAATDAFAVRPGPRWSGPRRTEGPHGEPDRRRGPTAPDADGAGLEVSGTGGPRTARPIAVGAADAAADADGHGPEGVRRFDADERDADRRGGSHGVRGEREPATPAADATGNGRHEGWTEPAGIIGRPDAAERSHDAPADPDEHEPVGQRLQRSGRAAVAWGGYEPAVRRWERVTRPAPLPWERGPKGGYRLAPAFSEWMMGLPAGWVTDVPGLTRNEQLKLLGNGVVPQQGAAGISLALDAAPEWVREMLQERAA